MSQPTEPSVDAEFASARTALTRRITKQRLLAWLPLPVAKNDRSIFAGLKPLTLRSLSELEQAGNKFIEDPQEAPKADLLAYLWAHLRRPVRFKKYCRICALADSSLLRAHALNHYALAVSENPAPVVHGKTSVDFRLPPVPSVATIADELGAAYGQSPLEVLDWPVQLAFQLMRAARRRAHGVEYPDHPELVHLKSLYLKALELEQEGTTDGKK